VSTSQVFSGYGNPTVWLIFTAFLFATAVTSTGFGIRVAYLFIRRFGQSPLTLGYSIGAAGMVLAPFVPSDTARGGGIISPVVSSIARAVGSDPGPTARELGSFLTLVGYHTNYTASAMFLTGMAANPLMADFARQVAHLDVTWTTWAVGASVPGLLALVIVPWVIFRLHPPRLRTTESARAVAREELRVMGPLTRRETWLVVILLLVMAGWVTSPLHGVSNTIVALAGVSALLLSGVISWDDLLGERKAWDALIWFGAVIMMADSLLQAGVVSVLSKRAFLYVQNWPAIAALIALVVVYVYVHYAFASMTAQVTALYPAFLAAALASGVSPVVSALSLAYFSNLNAATTHYGTGSAPVFFGTGYVTLRTWWRIGFLISLVHLLIWLGAGLLWWKLLGWW
jgi:DASS family divalent anion:Na+ symporter